VHVHVCVCVCVFVCVCVREREGERIFRICIYTGKYGSQQNHHHSYIYVCAQIYACISLLLSEHVSGFELMLRV